MSKRNPQPTGSDDDKRQKQKNSTWDKPRRQSFEYKHKIWSNKHKLQKDTLDS